MLKETSVPNTSLFSSLKNKIQLFQTNLQNTNKPVSEEVKKKDNS